MRWIQGFGLMVVVVVSGGQVPAMAGDVGATAGLDSTLSFMPFSRLDSGDFSAEQASLQQFWGCPRRMDPVWGFGGVGSPVLGASGSVLDPGEVPTEAGAATGMSSYLRSGYQTSRSDSYIAGGVKGGDARMDTRADLGAREAGNYSSPSGTVVPAGLSTRRAGLAATWHLSPQDDLWTSFTYLQRRNIDAPSQPMDTITADNLGGRSGLVFRRPGSTLGAISLTGGFTAVDQLLSNSHKPTVMTAPAEINGRIRAWNAHARTRLAGTGPEITLGADFSHQTQAFARRGVTLADGGAQLDNLDTRALQYAGGAYARADISLAQSSGLALEGRAQAVTSRSRTAEAPTVGNQQLLDYWIRYFGTEASDYDQTEWVGAGSATLGHGFSPSVRSYLRLEYQARPAGIGQRYYGFIPTPGGYRLGNPTLTTQKDLTVDSGLTWTSDALSVTATVFMTDARDYIIPRIIDRIDVDGDGVPDAIKGFLPRDAQLNGGSLGASWQPRAWMRMPLCVNYLRGRNTSESKDLPEIPPLSGYAELQFLLHSPSRTWFWTQVDFAADQSNIDAQFGENSTPGYAIWGVGLSVEPGAGLSLSLQVDNVFNREYHRHLTREAMLPADGLSQGQEIPAQGRNVRLAAQWNF